MLPSRCIGRTLRFVELVFRYLSFELQGFDFQFFDLVACILLPGRRLADEGGDSEIIYVPIRDFFVVKLACMAHDVHHQVQTCFDPIQIAPQQCDSATFEWPANPVPGSKLRYLDIAIFVPGNLC